MSPSTLSVTNPMICFSPNTKSVVWPGVTFLTAANHAFIDAILLMIDAWFCLSIKSALFRLQTFSMFCTMLRAFFSLLVCVSVKTLIDSFSVLVGVFLRRGRSLIPMRISLKSVNALRASASNSLNVSRYPRSFVSPVRSLINARSCIPSGVWVISAAFRAPTIAPSKEGLHI